MYGANFLAYSTYSRSQMNGSMFGMNPFSNRNFAFNNLFMNTNSIMYSNMRNNYLMKYSMPMNMFGMNAFSGFNYSSLPSFSYGMSGNIPGMYSSVFNSFPMNFSTGNFFANPSLVDYSNVLNNMSYMPQSYPIIQTPSPQISNQMSYSNMLTEFNNNYGFSTEYTQSSSKPKDTSTSVKSDNNVQPKVKSEQVKLDATPQIKVNKTKTPEISVKTTKVKTTDTANTNKLENLYNKALSTNLAKVAVQTAKKLASKNWCAKGVNDSLEAAGIVKKNETRMPSACQLTKTFDKCKSLERVDVPKSELKNLPAGCVVVWQGRGTKDGSFGQHGHVMITLGNGKEASDNIRDMKIYDTEYTVYVPVKTSKA